MREKKIILLFTCLLVSYLSIAQYTWKARDPLDLNVVDFGDNKVLLYNGIGIGLTLLLNKHESKLVQNHPKWDLSLSAYDGYRPEGSIYYLALRRHFMIRDFLSIGIESRLIRAQIDDGVAGVGVSPTFSWYFVRSERWRLAYDNGVGPNVFFTPFPTGGTRFNFSTFYGLRVAYRSGQGRWYHVSISNLHISNAEIKGKERNPPSDGVGISVGVSL